MTDADKTIQRHKTTTYTFYRSQFNQAGYYERGTVTYQMKVIDDSISVISEAEPHAHPEYLNEVLQFSVYSQDGVVPKHHDEIEFENQVWSIISMARAVAVTVIMARKK